MAQAERAVEIGALGDGENAGRRDDPVGTDDDAAVVERGFGKEKADHQFRRKLAVDLHSALGETLDKAGSTGFFWAFLVAGSLYLVTLLLVHLIMPKMTPLDDNLNPILK